MHIEPRAVPGGIAAAIMTKRPELARMTARKIRDGNVLLNAEDQAQVVELVADLLESANEDQDRLRDMLLRIKGIRDYGRGLESTAEALLVLVEGCGVKG